MIQATKHFKEQLKERLGLDYSDLEKSEIDKLITKEIKKLRKIKEIETLYGCSIELKIKVSKGFIITVPVVLTKRKLFLKTIY